MSLVFLFTSWVLLTRFVFPLPATTPFSGKAFIADEIIQKLATESPGKPPSILAYSSDTALNQSVPALAVAHFRAQHDQRIN